jgi:hypothetical protein
MRTKTTLAAAAILAAGLASSMAQGNVYSLNVVGYYNAPLQQTTALANSLHTGSDRMDQVIPYSVDDNVQVWNGNKWLVYTMDAASTTGWTDDSGADIPVANLPILGPGIGFLYGKNSLATQVTFVGEVRSGTITAVLPQGLTSTASPIPYSGLVNTSAVNLAVPLDDNIQYWTGNKWYVYTRDGASATTWTDDTGADCPEPSLAIGQGFFYGNNGAGPHNWVQTFTIP